MNKCLSMETKEFASVELQSDCLKIQSKSTTMSVPLTSLIGVRHSNRKVECLYLTASYKLKSYRVSVESPKEIEQLEKQLQSELYPCTKNIGIAINPISGSGKAKKILNEILLPMLEFTPHTYQIFQYTVPVEEVPQFSDIIMISGDGSLHTQITSIYKHDPDLLKSVAFSILPGGTRNSLSFELYGGNVTNACMQAIRGKPMQMDVLEVTTDSETILAINNVSWGIVSALCERAEKLRNMGNLRFLLSGASNFFRPWTPYRAHVSYQSENDRVGENVELQYLNVMNHPNSGTDGNVYSPLSQLDDNKMDLFMLPFGGRFATLSHLRQVSNGAKHIEDSRNVYTKIDHCSIEPAEMTTFNVDGEIYHSSRVDISVLPSFLNVIK